VGGWFGFKIFLEPFIRLVKGHPLGQLIRNLNSSKKDERVKAAKRLRMASPRLHERIVPPLLNALSDEDPSVVLEATKTLTRIAGEPAGDTAGSWRLWWDERTNQPPEEVNPS